MIFILVGCLLSFKLTLGGEFYVGEIVGLFFLFFNMNKLVINSEIRKIASFIFIWSVVQVISDLINEIDSISSIKGVLAPILLFTTLLAGFQFSKIFPEKLWFLIIGILLGGILNLEIFPNELYLFNSWKFGLGISVALVFFMCVERFKISSFSLLMLSLAFIFISLAQSSRSIAGIYLLTVLLHYLSNKICRSGKSIDFTSRKSNRYIAIVSIVFLMFFVDYFLVIVFTNDTFLSLLPDEHARKYYLQASSELGVLLSGRAELFVSSRAFLDSPIWGHGSWAEDPVYALMNIDLIQKNIFTDRSIETLESNLNHYLIPTHSFLMGAVVWGGIFAGIFWVYIILKIVDYFLAVCKYSLLKTYIAINLLWNILFSPFGADARWFSAVFILILIFIPCSYFKSKQGSHS